MDMVNKIQEKLAEIIAFMIMLRFIFQPNPEYITITVLPGILSWHICRKNK